VAEEANMLLRGAEGVKEWEKEEFTERKDIN